MSSSSSDAPQPAGSRRAGLLNRVWGALTGRTGAERIAAIWGLDANGQPTRKAPLPHQADAPAMPERSQADRIYLTVPFAEKDRVKALGARWDADRKAWFTLAGRDNGLLQQWVDAPTKDAPAPVPAARAEEGRQVLEVPFSDKENAKALGARWDTAARAWYVPAGVDRTPFAAWLPEKAKAADPVAEFADTLRRAGLRVEQPEMDGKLHRVQVEGDKGPREKSGAYVGHLDGWPAGFYQNFKTGGDKVNWKASGRPVAALSTQERTQVAADVAQRLRDRAREREGVYERTAEQVGAMWNAATPAGQHPYLDAKGVAAHGLRQDGRGNLLVPLQDAQGKLWSLQRIAPDGSKQFKADGRVDGGHYVIGDVARPGPLLVAEGFATAATVHEMTGHPVIAAFNAGNLGKVAEAYRARFPDRAIYLAGDNDHAKEAEGKPNVGREKAEAAAAAIGGDALVPTFPAGAKGSDWNDLAQSQGREAAGLALLVAIRAVERERMVAGMGATRLSDRAASRAPERTRAGREHEPAGQER